MAGGLLEKVIESAGGLEEFKRKREQFRQDLAFIEENKEKLLEDYDENWIAAYKSKIVAHGKDYNSVLSYLQKNNMPIDQIPIRYISKHKVFALYFMQ